MGSPTGEAHPNTDTLPYRGTSAGGGYSTVEDLLHFADALQQNKLLNPHYTDLLTTGKARHPRQHLRLRLAEDRKINLASAASATAAEPPA